MVAPRTEHPDEAGLVERLRAGDDRAREELYRAFFGRVYSWCRWLSGGRVDPEDAAAEVFRVAFEKAAGFRGEALLSTWLFRISRKVVATQRRKAWLGRLVGIETAVALSAPQNPETDTALREELSIAAGILDGLSAKKREAFILVDIGGCSLAEAAQALGVAVQTVGTRVFYARREFMKQWRRLTCEVKNDA
ncbi:MAG: RNA polymerase sigma factor [Deltaproteobacteria bacterium]|nr:RNA polymerase sigma factor [Deltaproteobacteria bacterium]